MLKVAPRLVVEVLLPSNRLADLVRKPELYAAAGLPWYWVVDLAEPSVRVLAERDGRLIEVQRLTGPGTTVGPYPVALDPAALGQ